MKHHEIERAIDAFTYLRDTYGMPTAETIAQAAAITQADGAESWLEEMAVALRFARIASSYAKDYLAFLDGSVFRDYQASHHGPLRWDPRVIRSDAQEWLGAALPGERELCS